MSEEKNTTPRDTQFAGFAQMLLHEMLHKEFPSVDIKLWNSDSLTDLEKIIARRAYDFACHILYKTGYGFDLFNIPDRVNEIPDFTKWPEETK